MVTPLLDASWHYEDDLIALIPRHQSGFLEVFKMALCCPPTYPTWRLKRRELDDGGGRLPILGIINPVNFPSEFFSCVNDASDLFAIMPVSLCVQ